MSGESHYLGRLEGIPGLPSAVPQTYPYMVINQSINQNNTLIIRFKHARAQNRDSVRSKSKACEVLVKRRGYLQFSQSAISHLPPPNPHTPSCDGGRDNKYPGGSISVHGTDPLNPTFESTYYTVLPQCR